MQEANYQGVKVKSAEALKVVQEIQLVLVLLRSDLSGMAFKDLKQGFAIPSSYPGRLAKHVIDLGGAFAAGVRQCAVGIIHAISPETPQQYIPVAACALVKAQCHQLAEWSKIVFDVEMEESTSKVSANLTAGVLLD